VKKNNRRGVVLVVSSPSGAGKTTICKKIINSIEDISLSVSVTTRKKRISELNGKDYFFKSRHDFLKMIENDEFVEHAKVFGNYYGTLKSEILEKIENGIDVLLDIDWQGTRQIQKYIPDDVVKVFVLPPTIKELEFRLGNRASENRDDFFKRMSEAKKEISHYNEYDFIIINEDINVAVNSITTILFAERLKKNRQKIIPLFVKNLL
jgi:guanylate kinase